ncbi:MAG: hypothetical protein GPOALKHO_000841 [Sodalis sp.]|nr:MAG: hypothetical protein GPOALKHO_000841 [Sodalis sp.]
MPDACLNLRNSVLRSAEKANQRPYMDVSFQINECLRIARRLLTINDSGLPEAGECLDKSPHNIWLI